MRDQGLLKGRRLDCVKFLSECVKPVTANELFRKMSGISTIAQANISARLFELREMGVIREAGQKTCPVTNMWVIAWEMTDRMPTAIPKKVKKKTKELEVITMLREALVLVTKHYRCPNPSVGGWICKCGICNSHRTLSATSDYE